MSKSAHRSHTITQHETLPCLRARRKENLEHRPITCDYSEVHSSEHTEGIQGNTRERPGFKEAEKTKREGRFVMAASEAQKRASAKYQREKTKQVNLKFSPNEMDLFDWLKAQDAPVSTTVKRLIREEIDRTA